MMPQSIIEYYEGCFDEEDSSMSCNEIDESYHLQDVVNAEFSFNEAERAGRVEGVIQGEMR